MSVLVDSSVWIAYFRGADDETLESLIDENLVTVNELILAELLPALYLRRQRRLITLLQQIVRPEIVVDWDDIVQMQLTCLRRGINRVGIPDLIIAQHAIQHQLDLYSYDKHFVHMADHLPLAIYR